MAELKDYGLQFLNPDRVTIDPPVANDWQTTRDGGGGVGRDQINAGLGHTKDVRAMYERGYGPEDFERLRSSSDPREKAIGDSQRMFWGDRPISITKTEDKIECSDGRHRLAAAQARGEKDIPMRVHAAANDSEFADKRFDAARHPEKREAELQGGLMSERGRRSPETPELANAKETKPPVDEHPELRADREKGYGQADKGSSSKGPSDSPNPSSSSDYVPEKKDSSTQGRGDKESRDPMDGGKHGGVEKIRGDKMDGAYDAPHKTHSDVRDMSDLKRGLG